MTTEATNPNAGDGASAEQAALEALETRDWTEALRDVMHRDGRERVTRLLKELQIQAQKHGAPLPVTSQTPYVNTIPTEHQPPFPGNREIERRIKSVVRWNAMAMVVEANEKVDGIGGHISTYASTATLYEIGFNHFFRGPDHPGGRRPDLLPGPRRARHLCARLRRAANDAAAAAQLPPRVR